MFTFRPHIAIKTVGLSLRCMSTRSNLIDLTVDSEGIALMSLKRLPVNSLNTELLQATIKNLNDVQKNGYKGLVITSALPKVFSAGVDLNELNSQNPKELRECWWMIQELCLKLYGAVFTTTVAINGHAAAGACVLSVLCDYRVMVNDGKARIGMNDTEVGIVPRPWICELFNRVMGYRQAEIALTASTMYTAEEALKVNLIDETAPDKEAAIEKCKQFIRRYDNIPLNVRAQTKRRLRASVLKYVEDNREEDIELITQAILDPYTQKQISTYAEQIKQRKIKNLD